ncbi:uncharacterized protein LOC122612757 [Drosophila teissieri]|uniref:uncharacterized protein LOC122612757 n=1 Tax=Drosophila teissieri TaxID=7243 RepID=UPI001CBA36BC|nr:uncharacterized protein LOC122612757 [Drosophila teissieri]
MPPFCCGGRRCANDLVEENLNEGGRESLRETIYTTTAEYERPLSLKFYARHDWPYFNCTSQEVRRIREKLDPVSLQNARKIASLDKGVEEKYQMKHNTPQPMTVNQMYGWYSDRAHRYLKRDRGTFVFPHENDPMIEQILRNKLKRS